MVLAVPAHLALTTVLPPERTAVLAALVLLFVTGRAAFAFGYPYGAPGRSFGFGLTVYSTMTAMAGALLLAL